MVQPLLAADFISDAALHPCATRITWGLTCITWGHVMGHVQIAASQDEVLMACITWGVGNLQFLKAGDEHYGFANPKSARRHAAAAAGSCREEIRDV